MAIRQLELFWTQFSRLSGSPDRPPASPGVYEIWVELKSKKLSRLYVGQANDIAERLPQHKAPGASNLELKNDLEKYKCWYRCCIPIADSATRMGLELALYKKHNYEFNKVAPAGDRNITIIIEKETIEK